MTIVPIKQEVRFVPINMNYVNEALVLFVICTYLRMLVSNSISISDDLRGV